MALSTGSVRYDFSINDGDEDRIVSFFIQVVEDQSTFINAEIDGQMTENEKWYLDDVIDVFVRVIYDIQKSLRSFAQDCLERFDPDLPKKPLKDSIQQLASLSLSSRRGGPKPTPENDKRQLIEGWRLVQNTTSQDAYCAKNAISPATLRRWMQELEANGEGI